MKPAIQIATAELMALRNDFTVAFAKTRLALTPPDLLVSSTSRKSRADSAAAQVLIEEDTESLVRSLKRVEESYGSDILTLTVSSTYIERLFEQPKIVRYLERFHGGVLDTLRGLVMQVHPAAKSSE